MNLRINDFSLDDTLAAGQTFCWHALQPGVWRGWIQDQPVLLRAVDSERKLEVIADHLAEDSVAAYLGLNRDPFTALAACLNDQPLRTAVEATRGLRCIHDPWWECTANFICSSLKQIPHIRRINATLRRRFGTAAARHEQRVIERVAGPCRSWADGGNRFPSAARLAELSEADLRDCGLGYRARHLHRAARMVASGEFDPAALFTLNTSDATKLFCTLPGVGEKVAHCVLIYALHRWDAFPLDVWMIRVMHRTYFPRRRRAPQAAEIHRKSVRLFGPLRGLAQVHLFHHARMNGVASASVASTPKQKQKSRDA